MSVHQQLVNFNKIFSQLTKPPVIVNDLHTATEEDKEDLNRKIYTLYDSGVMDTIASCECGKITGDFNIGVICSSCNSAVTSPSEDDLDPLLWIRTPDEIESLFNPHVWLILNEFFCIGSFSLIRYIADTTYNPPKEMDVVAKLHEAGIQRGYNWLVQNFWFVIEKLSSLSNFAKDDKSISLGEVMRMLTEYKDCIFCNYLPLPNRALLVIEKTNVGKFVDEVYANVINAIQMIASIDIGKNSKKTEPSTASVQDLLYTTDPNDIDDDSYPELLPQAMSLKRKENRVAKMLTRLAAFYNTYYKNNFAKKAGIFRKHIYASRAHFSARSVIVSITEPHEYDEFHIPWTTGIAVLRYHLLNKLEKRGYLPNQALALLNDYARRYHPLLDELFKELIEESVYVNPDTGQYQKGIVCSVCRNPSLWRGSIVRLRITKVKPDPKQLCFSLSILAVRSLNADFDGDAIGMMLALDDVMADALNVHRGAYNVFDVSRPRQLSDTMAIPKPVVANINRWYNDTVESQPTAEMDRFLV